MDPSKIIFLTDQGPHGLRSGKRTNQKSCDNHPFSDNCTFLKIEVITTSFLHVLLLVFAACTLSECKFFRRDLL